MEPTNYLSQVADPFVQAAQGLQLGAGMVELQQKQALMAQQQRQQQLVAQEQALFLKNLKPTMRDAARYASFLSPDQSKAFLPYMEGISKEQQQNTLKSVGQILSALQFNPPTGIQKLKDYATTQRNTGDEAEAELYDRLAEAAADQKRGPAVAFKSLVTIASPIPGAKEMFESIDKASTTAIAEGLAPSKLREAQIKNQNDMADLRIKLQNEPNKARQLELETEIKELERQQAEVKAKYAEREAAAGLGLTGAQTAQANAAAAKYKKDLEDEGVKVQSSNILPNGTVVFVTTNGKTRVVGPDGVELTGQERVDAVREAEQFGADIQQLRSGARKAGEIGQTEAAKAFESVGKIRRNISNLDSAIAALDAGATTGVIANKFPNWRASTIELQNVQRQLGLDIIGSVTFGALSEGELSLALETALPLNMNEPQLKDWLIRKKTAQNKLADYITEQARFLSIPGRSLGDWLIQAEKRGQPPGMTAPGTGAAGAAAAAAPPAAPPAAPGTGATVRVTLPNGSVKQFPNQQAADAFKRAAGIP